MLVIFPNPTVTAIGWTTFTPSRSIVKGLTNMNELFEPQLVAKVETATLSADVVEIAQLVQAFLGRTCCPLKKGPVGN